MRPVALSEAIAHAEQADAKDPPGQDLAVISRADLRVLVESARRVMAMETEAPKALRVLAHDLENPDWPLSIGWADLEVLRDSAADGAAAREELESERKVHDIGKAFHDLACKERDYERTRRDRLTGELAAARAEVERLRAEVTALRKLHGEACDKWGEDELSLEIETARADQAEARVRELEAENKRIRGIAINRGEP